MQDDSMCSPASLDVHPLLTPRACLHPHPLLAPRQRALLPLPHTGPQAATASQKESTLRMLPGIDCVRLPIRPHQKSARASHSHPPPQHKYVNTMLSLAHPRIPPSLQSLPQLQPALAPEPCFPRRVSVPGSSNFVHCKCYLCPFVQTTDSSKY